MAAMARMQVLVQLDDAQVEQLDRIAGSVEDSRSELIRRAIDLYVEAVEGSVEDLRYAAAYQRLADDPVELEAFQALAASGWPKD